MVVLLTILITIFVYTEGNQLKFGPETLTRLSDQPAQLQDLLSVLKAREMKNNAESESFSRSEGISINEYHHGQIKNNKQQQESTFNLYTKPYIVSLPVRNQEIMSQSELCTNENSDLKNKYEKFQELGVTDKSIENIKESFTYSSEFQHNKENLPYIPDNVNIKFNNFYTPINSIQDFRQVVSTEKGSQNVGDQGYENTFYHNNDSTNSYQSQEQIQGIVSSSPFNYVKNINHDNKHTHSIIQNIQSQEKPKHNYIFSWLPQNSKPDIEDLEKDYILNRRNKELTKITIDKSQYEDPHIFKQSFYPKVEATIPSPYYGKANKIQNEYYFNKQLEKVPYNPAEIIYYKENDHTQQDLDQGRSHLEALYNFLKNKNIEQLKEIQKDIEPNHQESVENETLKIVKKKALDVAQATNQKPPIIIHRLVTITKHIPVPIIRHANLTHSFQYKHLHPVKRYQYYM